MWASESPRVAQKNTGCRGQRWSLSRNENWNTMEERTRERLEQRRADRNIELVKSTRLPIQAKTL